MEYYIQRFRVPNREAIMQRQSHLMSAGTLLCLCEQSNNCPGRQCGISFTVDGTIANTLDSHRVAEWILRNHGEEAQNKAIEEMFHSYFENGISPADVDMLCRAAEAGGASKVLYIITCRWIVDDEHTG